MSKKLFFVSISLVGILVLPIFSLGQTTGQVQAGQMQAGQAQVPSLSQIDCSQYTNTQEKLMCTYFNTLLQLYTLLIQQLQAKIGNPPIQQPVEPVKPIQPIQPNQPSITILSPNGGELFYIGKDILVRFSKTNLSPDSQLSLLVRLRNTQTNTEYALTNINTKDTEFTVNIPSNIPFGSYVLELKGYYENVLLFDKSDAPFLVDQIMSITPVLQLSINKTNFILTDNWELNLRGAPPNQQVYICAIDNRGAQSCTPAQNLGLRQTTDLNGNWSASGNWNGDESVIGNWTEWVYVGGTLQNGQVTGGARSNNINFTISRPQQICNGYPTLVITPPSATINVSQTQNFRALYDPDGPSCPQAEQDKTSEVSWNSSNSNIASSNGNGSFTGRSAGSATITATFSGIIAWATLNVNQPPQIYKPYLSINKTNFVTIDTWYLNLTNAPPNQQVYICAIDNRGAQSCTPAQNLGLRQTTDSNGNWSASGNWNGDESVIGNWTEWVYVGGTLQNGQVTGGARSNNINFTISRPQQICNGYPTLVITPPSATINVSQTQNFRALYDPDGPSCPQAEQDKTSEVSWNSSNSNIASSNGNGSFTGRSAGSATITATFSGIIAWATLNVNQPPQIYKPYLSINKTNFVTIDTWYLNLTNAPPNQQVYICAIDNRGAQSCTPAQNLGLRQTTDSNGNWSASGNWNGDESVAGTWREWIYVGGTLQGNQVIGGTKSNEIQFTISIISRAQSSMLEFLNQMANILDSLNSVLNYLR